MFRRETSPDDEPFGAAAKSKNIPLNLPFSPPPTRSPTPSPYVSIPSTSEVVTRRSGHPWLTPEISQPAVDRTGKPNTNGVLSVCVLELLHCELRNLECPDIANFRLTCRLHGEMGFEHFFRQGKARLFVCRGFEHRLQAISQNAIVS